MSRSIDDVLQAATAQGLLTVGTTAPAHETRPWPVLLLTALGAWLAAIPLIGVIGMLFGALVTRDSGLYVVGMLTLAGAVVVLRARGVPLFVEQLALPALLSGAGALGVALVRDLPGANGFLVLGVLALAIAAVVPRPWLRALLGAAAAGLVAAATLDRRDPTGGEPHLWQAWHVVLALWLGALWLQRSVLIAGTRARIAAAVESIGAGWLLALLAGLAFWSGMTLLVAGSAGGLGSLAGTVGRPAASSFAITAPQAISLALAALAAWWAARGWPRLRTPLMAGVAVVAMALAWFMPALGAVLLALSVCATSARLRLAAAAALAAAWIVGAFYYQLAWPLASKALLLAAAGAVLAALAWLQLRAGAPRSAADVAAAAAPLPRRGLGIAGTAVAVLAVANFAIWQKEDLIARGQPLFVELAPVDPRSLMQGDFMTLNYRLPGELRDSALLGAARPSVVATVDERRVATALRPDAGTPLGPGELRIELTPKGGRWILVSDAWFFAEGEGERWARARYGEFRVDSSGRALLVGLRGAALEPLPAKASAPR